MNRDFYYEKTLQLAVPALIIICFFSGCKEKGLKAAIHFIHGCWKGDRIEFSEPVDDVVSVNENFRSNTICFDQDGKFRSISQLENNELVVTEGVYSLEDEKFLVIKRLPGNKNSGEEGADEKGEIIQLSSDHLIMKTENITMYLNKAK